MELSLKPVFATFAINVWKVYAIAHIWRPCRDTQRAFLQPHTLVLSTTGSPPVIITPVRVIIVH